jgi:acetate kinase
MRVLVVNSGSSSLKYRLLDLGAGTTVAGGLVERIGEAGSDVADHAAALALVVTRLRDDGALDAGVDAVGHRVVHGGERFSAPVVVDDAVVAAVRELAPLAPLHNPPNLLGIEAARAAFPGVPQVAVFDTAFHQSMPPAAYTYAIPRDLARRHGIRRYGFHGTSHRYVARVAAGVLGRPADAVDLVTLHLGNGASACAVRAGRSVDTSMGLSPLEGLVMGTRSGDVDPAVVFHLVSDAGLAPDEVDGLLNRASGLRGLAGANDLREVHRRASSGDRDAALALDVYGHRLRKYVGAYLAVLGGADAVVFTGGVGENDPDVRHRAVGGLDRLGVVLDEAANAAVRGPGRPVDVAAAGSSCRVLVIPTDEEREIAEQAAGLL